MPYQPTHQAAIDALHAIDPILYATRRNYLHGSTELSPYITRGALTLPQIREFAYSRASAEQSHTLIYELAWREYWQREWQYRKDLILQDIKRPQQGVESDYISRAIIDASTGIEALDQQVQQLYETGWIHNHARLWIAGLACSIAHSHWLQPSKWLYYHLLDGDPASNSLSWQWVAGTFSSKQYLPAQSNINQYTDSNQQGTYLDASYEELAVCSTPEPLVDRATDLALSWKAPQVAALELDTTLPTALYHPFWINAAWHKSEQVNRVLVLDPAWFKQWPVSSAVTDWMVQLALDIPGMQLFVGSFADLPAGNYMYVEHPYTAAWSGQAEQMERLFPDCPDRSYNSFSSFWKAAQKSIQ